MKLYFTLLLSVLTGTLLAQQDTAAKKVHKMHAPYYKNAIVATTSLGFIDNNRQSYSLPSGFSKGGITGFIPFFAKVEYGLTRQISLGATFCYDAFVYNNLQDYTGNNGAFTRYRTNNTRILNGGLTAFYHFGKVLHTRQVDPFIGVGVSLNNIRYHAYPQGDSTAVKIDHTVTPYLKAGARYYITNQFSLYGDAGYDKQAVITIGFSCRFFTNRRL